MIGSNDVGDSQEYQFRLALSPLDWSEEIMEDEAEEKKEQSADHDDAETWSVLETDVQF